MDKKSKTLLTIIILATIASVSFTFYKTIIKNDFEIDQQDIDSVDTNASDGIY